MKNRSNLLEVFVPLHAGLEFAFKLDILGSDDFYQSSRQVQVRERTPTMIDTNELFALPAAEKIRIVEMLWDDLGKSNEPIPLPAWVDQEAARRREEMRESSFGLTHEETWRRIAQRNG